MESSKKNNRISPPVGGIPRKIPYPLLSGSLYNGLWLTCLYGRFTADLQMLPISNVVDSDKIEDILKRIF